LFSIALITLVVQDHPNFSTGYGEEQGIDLDDTRIERGESSSSSQPKVALSSARSRLPTFRFA
jgi:hypothetical protein